MLLAMRLRRAARGSIALISQLPPTHPLPHTHNRDSIITSSAVPLRSAPRPLFRAFQSSANFLDTNSLLEWLLLMHQDCPYIQTRLCGFFKPVYKLLRWLWTNVYGVHVCERIYKILKKAFLLIVNNSNFLDKSIRKQSNLVWRRTGAFS